MILKAGAIAVVVYLLATGAAWADTVKFRADLSGANEVLPNMTPGRGDVSATLDTATKTFAYTVTYSGLTGPAIAARFHGPARPGVIAPPIITVTQLTSPIKGAVKLNAPQIHELIAGQWYFNIYTAAHMGGEIRGQLSKAPLIPWLSATALR